MDDLDALRVVTALFPFIRTLLDNTVMGRVLDSDSGLFLLVATVGLSTPHQVDGVSVAALSEALSPAR